MGPNWGGKIRRGLHGVSGCTIFLQNSPETARTGAPEGDVTGALHSGDTVLIYNIYINLGSNP